LILDTSHPTLDNSSIVQGALGAFERRIANQSGRSAHQRNWAVAEELKPPQRQERNEIADMKALGGWIKPAIECARCPLEVAFQGNAI
jgi:hypothetical protein